MSRARSNRRRKRRARARLKAWDARPRTPELSPLAIALRDLGARVARAVEVFNTYAARVLVAFRQLCRKLAARIALVRIDPPRFKS